MDSAAESKQPDVEDGAAVINLLRRAQLDHVVAQGLKRGVIVNKQSTTALERRPS